MALLYQHEKNLLEEIAKHYEERAEHWQAMTERPRRNEKIYLRMVDEELEKVRVLRKAT